MNKHAIRILLNLMNAPQLPLIFNECDVMNVEQSEMERKRAKARA